jgi:hypothetical protein
MKNPLSDIYDQILLSEAEKHQLQNPSSDEVGSLKVKQDLFGDKPKPVEGPEKAKLQKGPSYKETTGLSSSSHAEKTSKSSMPNSAPAKGAKTEEGEEMEDTEVDPTKEKKPTEGDSLKKKKVAEESFTMSAFETLFKKTLTEEVDDIGAPESSDTMEDSDLDLDLDMEDSEESEEDMEAEEGDLVSDLRDLADRLQDILNKLEDIQSEEEGEEGMEDEYTEGEFNEEFEGEEGEDDEDGEASFKESLDKPKPLNSSKGKALMSKKNKVGRLSAKGGKASSGSLKHEPKPKALGDRKGGLQKGKPEVKSSVKKGDFIK